MLLLVDEDSVDHGVHLMVVVLDAVKKVIDEGLSLVDLPSRRNLLRKKPHGARSRTWPLHSNAEKLRPASGPCDVHSSV